MYITIFLLLSNIIRNFSALKQFSTSEYEKKDHKKIKFIIYW